MCIEERCSLLGNCVDVVDVDDFFVFKLRARKQVPAKVRGGRQQ